nr:MAG TPA: hypothetical protein [Caudoviricetes sp.]
MEACDLTVEVKAWHNVEFSSDQVVFEAVSLEILKSRSLEVFLQLKIFSFIFDLVSLAIFEVETVLADIVCNLLDRSRNVSIQLVKFKEALFGHYKIFRREKRHIPRASEEIFFMKVNLISEE